MVNLFVADADSKNVLVAIHAASLDAATAKAAALGFVADDDLILTTDADSVTFSESFGTKTIAEPVTHYFVKE